MNYEDMSREDLIDRLEAVEFELAEMKGTRVSNIWGFRLPKAVWTAVCMLAAQSPRTVTYSALLMGICHDPLNPPDERTVTTQICHARKELSKLGLEIITDRGIGYSMSAKDGETWKRWISEADSGLPPCDAFILARQRSLKVQQQPLGGWFDYNPKSAQPFTYRGVARS